VVIALLYGLWPSWQTLLVVPGIILVSINGISIGMLLGTLCARFRDIPADRADHHPDDVPADADPVATEPDSGA